VTGPPPPAPPPPLPPPPPPPPPTLIPLPKLVIRPAADRVTEIKTPARDPQVDLLAEIQKKMMARRGRDSLRVKYSNLEK